jgi:maltose O-acetyltransferase
MNIFERLLILIFNTTSYRFYRRKYMLPSGFRFNGYFIRLFGDGDIRVGENSYISFFSYINVSEGTRVNIGSDVSIGHNVKIYTSQVDTHAMITSGVKKSLMGDVTIGDNVLIGANVFITPGVCIGSNVVIGANSFVNSNVESNCVAVGSPCKVVRSY